MTSRKILPLSVSRLMNVVIPGFLLLFLCLPAHPQSGGIDAGLYGTEWSLIRFEGGDGIVLVPSDHSAYTVSFTEDRRVSVRVDCNQGRGTWSSRGREQIEFSPLVLTWAQCPDSTLNKHLPKDFQAMQSYVIKEGHLFLFLKANGGNYEFAPLPLESGRQKEVRGTVSYRERLVLPPDAVLEVMLEDVPAFAVPAVIVAQTTIRQPGSPPIPFVIPYASSAIDAGHRYRARARILVAGQLLFATDQAQPVLTSGTPAEVSLLLRRASFEQPADRSPRPVALENAYWKLTQLEKEDLPPADHRRVPYLLFDSKAHRLSGSTGCNRLVGGYELDGERLTLSHVATSRMACITGMDLEQRFMEILRRVNSWKINGYRLELSDSSGNRLAIFEVSSEEHLDDQ